MTRYAAPTTRLYIGLNVDTPDGPGYVLKVDVARDAWGFARSNSPEVVGVEVRLHSEPWGVEASGATHPARSYAPEDLAPRRSEPTVTLEEWLAARATPGFKPKAPRRPVLRPRKLSDAQRAELYAEFNVTEEGLS